MNSESISWISATTKGSAKALPALVNSLLPSLTTWPPSTSEVPPINPDVATASGLCGSPASFCLILSPAASNSAPPTPAPAKVPVGPAYDPMMPPPMAPAVPRTTGALAMAAPGAASASCPVLSAMKLAPPMAASATFSKGCLGSMISPVIRSFLNCATSSGLARRRIWSRSPFSRSNSASSRSASSSAVSCAVRGIDYYLSLALRSNSAMRASLRCSSS